MSKASTPGLAEAIAVQFISASVELESLRDLLGTFLNELNVAKDWAGNKIDPANLSATELMRIANFITQVRK